MPDGGHVDASERLVATWLGFEAVKSRLHGLDLSREVMKESNLPHKGSAVKSRLSRDGKYGLRE